MNFFGNRFQQILKENDLVSLVKSGKKEGIPFYYLKPNDDLITLSISIAKQKANFTMSANQAGEDRDMQEKIIKQFQGVYAEMLVHLIMLKSGLKVNHFDLERESFEYSKDEYDLKITKNSGEIAEIEVRSTFDKQNIGVKRWHSTRSLIGPYTSKSKFSEELNDFYFSVVYFGETTQNLAKAVYDREVFPVVLGMANKEEMQTISVQKDLYQKGTLYKVIDFKKLRTLEIVRKEISK